MLTLRRRATRFALALGLLSVAAVSPAWGDPIPSEPLVAPVAGESDLSSFTLGDSSDVTIDWMVIETDSDFLTSGDPSIAGGGFAYLFQLENTTSVGPQALTITMSSDAASSILSVGFLAGDDLDLASAFHPEHADSFFGNLTGEEEGFALEPVTSGSASVNVGDGSVTWTFDSVTVGAETDTLAFIAKRAPIYGIGTVINGGGGGSPWDTRATPASDPLPVPGGPVIPEPGSAALFSLGLLGLSWKGQRAR